ncbi:unnamed protein product [Brachionus calyciflorus]|uniref:NAD(P)(+)--arginine ADP-ribosyltransferase n=1 Tax=Brachionus calyciflorus TaxID=104777 RepID=A0A814J8I5_9BILA|nr:unnamed protein product [Brachionus calyciflorus]
MVLGSLNPTDIQAFEIWIKTLNLSLKTFSQESNTDLNVKLYRGVSLADPNAIRNYTKGYSICFPSFTSTSKSTGVANCFRGTESKTSILFEINLSERSRNCRASIEKISAFNEAEYLFGPFSTFVVQNISQRLDQNFYEISLEEI